eukprot:551857-Ditylum_brightwellii.AAC.1
MVAMLNNQQPTMEGDSTIRRDWEGGERIRLNITQWWLCLTPNNQQEKETQQSAGIRKGGKG